VSSAESEEQRFRSFLSDALERVRQIHERLRMSESRLRRLEGSNSPSEVTWDATRRRADAMIAGLTAVEVGARTFDVSGEGLSGQPLAAMPQFTADDLEAVSSMGEASQFGAINMIQGYLGEERALDAINAGIVPVPEGRYADFAETSNQPGYDLRLVSDDGAPDLFAQVKISDSGAIIREHLERYPEVSIVYTNTEAAQAMVGDPGVTVVKAEDVFPEYPGRYVVDLGFTKDEIRSGAIAMVESGDVTSFGDQLQENIPWIALTVIAGRAAYEFLDTDEDVSVILRTARRRIAQAIIASGASTAVTAATSEPLLGTAAGVGALFGGRAVSGVREDLRFATERLRRMFRMFLKIDTDNQK
jgi:hypothetical protein